MADRYWVGGTGTWNGNSGSRWSNVSGGSGGYSVPGSGDNAIFDSNSGGGTITVGNGRLCSNLVLTGFTGKFAGARTSSLTVYGSSIYLTGSTGQSMPGNGPFLVIAASCTLYTNGSTIGDLYINPSYSLTLGSDVASKNDTTINNYGTLNLNGYNLTIGYLFNQGTLNMSSGTMQCIQSGPLTGSQSCFYNNSNLGGTVNASTSTLRCIGARGSSGLKYAINSTDTSIVLVDFYLDINLVSWPTSGTIQIDNEIISYSGTSGVTNSVTLTITGRGLYNTAPASHSAGATALLLGLMQTTLTSAANSGDGTLTVADTTNFQGNGWLEVGGEIISYTSKDSTNFYGCARGQTQYGGTGIAFHASGSIVRQSQRRVIYLGTSTYNIVEFATGGGYVMSDVNDSPTIGTVRAAPYLPANPLPMQYVRFLSTPTITNFNLNGRRGTQGIFSQPVYVNGRTGQNTSTVNYVSGYPTSPNMPYTYTGGDPGDFDSFM
jgi:hypothetical protein